MALKCVTCGLLFRSRNELDWHIRQEHLQQRLPPTKDSRRRARLRPRTGGERQTKRLEISGAVVLAGLLRADCGQHGDVHEARQPRHYRWRGQANSRVVP